MPQQHHLWGSPLWPKAENRGEASKRASNKQGTTDLDVGNTTSLRQSLFISHWQLSTHRSHTYLPEGATKHRGMCGWLPCCKVFLEG